MPTMACKPRIPAATKAPRLYTESDAIAAVRAFAASTGLTIDPRHLVEAATPRAGAYHFRGEGYDYCIVRFVDDDGTALVSRRVGDRCECRRVQA
jgi:hypothetical protein